MRWPITLVHITSASLALASPASPPSHDKPTSATISIPLFSELERLARLVDVSYCIGNTGVRKPFNCISRCNEFPTLELVTAWNTGLMMGDSCGYIAVDHGKRQHEHQVGDGQRAIVVAFRGTYSLANTIIDLSTVPQKYTPYPADDHEDKCANCTVHSGFLQSWESARHLVLPEIVSLKEQYPEHPIHLIGHSLGGSVACLAGLELKSSLGFKDVIVTTFGEPRLGNDRFVHYIDKTFNLSRDTNPEQRAYRRVTHHNDPVPLLPLSEWGYRSHAGEIYISKDNLSPTEKDVIMCFGDSDPECITGAGGDAMSTLEQLPCFKMPVAEIEKMEAIDIPTRYKLWQLLFAHRDYFWRLGLCVPGGDPANWGRTPYDPTSIEGAGERDLLTGDEL